MTEPKVIYENKDFLVINKPAGLSVHGTEITNYKLQITKQSTLVDWLLEKYPEIKGVGDEPELRPGIVHRLDKDTSGIMVIAKNQRTFDYLKEKFKKREIEKKYLAIVYGVPKQKSGIIDLPITKKKIKRKYKGVVVGEETRNLPTPRLRQVGKKQETNAMVREAITEYKVLKTFGDYSLVELTPKTGRTHQIRIHLKAIGCPIVGDILYGHRKQNISVPRQMLHARFISFTALDGSKMAFEADPPEDFQEVSDQLKIAP